jgi:hypothetical protein
VENRGAKLIGSWRTDPNDNISLSEYGDVSLRFDANGTLVYTVYLPTGTQVIFLTYRLDANWLVTDQPSSPREERTEFFIMSDGRLALKAFGAATVAFFVRDSSA